MHLTGFALDPCNPCQPASLDRPVFSSFDTASLDDHTMPTDFARHFSGKRVAIYCCNYTSLPRAVFSPFETASLDPLLTVPQGLANHGVMRLAVC